MSSFNESVGLGYLKTNAIEFVKYPLDSGTGFPNLYIAQKRKKKECLSA